MILYAPLDDVAPVIRRQVAPAPVVQGGGAWMSNATECNYLLLFFVVGVIGLAIKDMSSK